MTNPRDVTDAELVAHARDAVAQFVVDEDLKENPARPQVHNRAEAMRQKGVGADAVDRIILFLGGHATAMTLDEVIASFSDGTIEGAEEVLGILKGMQAEGRVEIAAGKVRLR